MNMQTHYALAFLLLSPRCCNPRNFILAAGQNVTLKRLCETWGSTASNMYIKMVERICVLCATNFMTCH